MLRLLLRLFVWDETAAAGLLRGALMAIGTAVATGMIDVSAFGLSEGAQKWIGIALLAAGGWVRSSTAKDARRRLDD